MDNQIVTNVNLINQFISQPRRLLTRCSRPAYSSQLVPEDYASHGVLETVTPLQLPNEDMLNVGIFASAWPGWATPFAHKKFYIQWIITFTPALIPILRRCFPSTLILSTSALDVSRLTNVDIVAFNGPLSRLLEPPAIGSILLFDWNMRFKSGWEDWRIHHEPMSHSACGGVSDFVGCIKCCIHISSEANFRFETSLLSQFPLATLGSVLNHTESGEDLLQAPRLPRLSSPSVTGVTHKSYHPDGLFPSSQRRPSFLVPCVFSASRWVKRSLTSKELLAVKDLPVSIISILAAHERKLVYNSTFMPLKCLTAFISATFMKGVVTITGGGKEDNDGLLVNPPRTLSPSHISSKIDSSTSNSTIPGAWKENEKHFKDEKAAKNDNAGIPIHFWNDALATKLSLPSLTVAQEHGLNTLREVFGQRIWRRRVTKCFCSYIRCKGCHNDRLTAMFNFKDMRKKFSCRRCKQHLPPPNKFQAVNYSNNKYTWTNEGRAKYAKWYNVFRKKASASESKEIELDIAAGVDCIRRAIGCTAWSWNEGSSLFFWRWGEFSESTRDGARVCVKGKLPNYSKRQKAPSKGKNLKLVQDKLNDVRRKGYISKGEVVSVTSLFDVPKGTDDIRLVYDATKSGLNEAVWAPWFALQTCESHLRAVEPGTFMGDADLGEMFLNFPLDKYIRKYAGVDFTSIFPGECIEDELFWERWVRMLMGFRPSPYLTTREMRRIDLFLRGATDNPDNIFRWSKVIMNLPGMSDYNPKHPKVFRVRDDHTMAADLFSYIDDLRNTGPTSVECWDGLHQVCCRLTWLGLQDAPRKRNGPTQTPRAWAGSIIHSDQDLVTVLVSEEKWDKTKTWITWVLEHLEDQKGLPYQELLSCRGFLIYVSRTYGPFKPYLRGLHKTIDSWRPFRDKDGWKLLQSVIDNKMAGGLVPESYSEMTPTKFIKPLPRLRRDFEILKDLTTPAAPPKVIKRRNGTASAIYGFGDASGKGFGNAIEVGGHIYEEFGQWSAEVEDKHSNYKELRNLVNAVSKAYERGILQDRELFLFTDNFVAECGYYNGGSNRNKELDDLVHKLWKLQMNGEFTLHVYHVAGTRMIASGIDGLSRGDKSEGIAKGDSIINFIPIHQSPLERSKGLSDWVKSWWDDSLGKLHLMTPEDWFSKQMDQGNFLWDVPPGAGEIAVDQLCSHTHGRPETHHIFLIPRLCTCHWRKQLLKVCDVVLTISPKFSFWSTHMHEPLLVGIHFPLLPPDVKFRPWKLKHTEFVERFRTNLHRVQATSKSVDWNLLREFLLQARSIPSLPDGLARDLLQDKVWGPVSNCKTEGASRN